MYLFLATRSTLIFICSASSRYHHPKTALWLPSFTRGRPWATWCTHAMAASSKEPRCLTAASLACRLQRPRPSSPDSAGMIRMMRGISRQIMGGQHEPKKEAGKRAIQPRCGCCLVIHHVISRSFWLYHYLPFFESFTYLQPSTNLQKDRATMCNALGGWFRWICLKKNLHKFSTKPRQPRQPRLKLMSNLD